MNVTQFKNQSTKSLKKHRFFEATMQKRFSTEPVLSFNNYLMNSSQAKCPWHRPSSLDYTRARSIADGRRNGLHALVLRFGASCAFLSFACTGAPLMPLHCLWFTCRSKVLSHVSAGAESCIGVQPLYFSHWLIRFPSDLKQACVFCLKGIVRKKISFFTLVLTHS